MYINENTLASLSVLRFFISFLFSQIAEVLVKWIKIVVTPLRKFRHHRGILLIQNFYFQNFPRYTLSINSKWLLS